MNNERFRNMQDKLSPSPAAQSELREKLAALPEKRRIPWRRYATACAAVFVLAAVSLLAFRSRNSDPEPRLHSYQVSKMSSSDVITGLSQALEGVNQESASPAGPATEEDDPNLSENMGSPTQDPAVGSSSSASSSSRSGGDVAVQPATELYFALMDWFFPDSQSADAYNAYPDWYGGAWIGEDPDVLFLCLTEDGNTPERQEEIRAAIRDRLSSGTRWEPDHISFTQGRFSLNDLRNLQASVDADPVISAVCASTGVSEPENRLMVDLTEPQADALVALARLDPDDTAIQVNIVEIMSVPDEEDDTSSTHTDSHITPPPAPSSDAPGEKGVTELPEQKPVSDLPAQLQPDDDSDLFSFTGTVLEVQDRQILVETNMDAGSLHKGDPVWCSWDDTSFLSVGDTVQVTFNGFVLETYPAQIRTAQSLIVLE